MERIYKLKKDIEFWRREIRIKQHIIAAILEMNTDEYYINNIDNDTEEHKYYAQFNLGNVKDAEAIEDTRRSHLKRMKNSIADDMLHLEYCTNALIRELENELTDLQIEKDLL